MLEKSYFIGLISQINVFGFRRGLKLLTIKLREGVSFAGCQARLAEYFVGERADKTLERGVSYQYPLFTHLFQPLIPIPAAAALEKWDGRPERQHRVRGRSIRPRPREFVFEGEPVFPEGPRPANGEGGSKAVCSVALRNAIDVCAAAIVVARADSCIPSLTNIVTVKGRAYPERILRGLIVSLERIIIRKEA